MRTLSGLFLISSLTIISMLPTSVYAQDPNVITQKVIKNGSQRSIKGSEQFFTGNVRIDPLFPAVNPSRTSGAYVTFAPGARSAWHTHPLGQTLIVTSGVGYTQEWGGSIVEIHPGDVITCPPGIKHWHGASPQNAMTHLSIVEEIDGKNVVWMEKVTDVQYQAKHQ